MRKIMYISKSILHNTTQSGPETTDKNDGEPVKTLIWKDMDSLLCKGGN